MYIFPELKKENKTIKQPKPEVEVMLLGPN